MEVKSKKRGITKYKSLEQLLEEIEETARVVSEDAETLRRIYEFPFGRKAYAHGMLHKVWELEHDLKNLLILNGETEYFGEEF